MRLSRVVSEESESFVRGAKGLLGRQSQPVFEDGLEMPKSQPAANQFFFIERSPARLRSNRIPLQACESCLGFAGRQGTGRPPGQRLEQMPRRWRADLFQDFDSP